MPSLRHEDHDAVKGWLADLELKSSQAPIGFVGGGYGGSYGSGSGYGFLGFGMDGQGSPADGPTYLNGVVAACLGWLDRNFPVADLRVIKITTEGDGPEIPNHAFAALMKTPSAIDDAHSFWQSFLLSDVVDGNTFFVKVRNGAGGIHSLWWVPPWDVAVVGSPTRDANRPIERYDIRVGGEPIPYKPEDVIHIKDGKDPFYPLRGLAKLKAGLRSVSVIDRAELYTQALMGNMGAIPYMLSPANPAEQINPDNVAALRSQFAERQTGYNNGKPFVSTQGLRLDKLGLTPEEMALDTIRDFPVALICALIGTPAMAVGLPDPGKTYSNLDLALRSAWENGLMPRQSRVAAAFGRQCPELINPKTERPKWDYTHVKALQEDQGKRIEYLVKAVGGPFMTGNEARDIVHLDPIEGGDELNSAHPPAPQMALGPDGQPQPKPPKLSVVPDKKPPQQQLPPPQKSIELEREDGIDPFLKSGVPAPSSTDSATLTEQEATEAATLVLSVAGTLGLARRFTDGSLTPTEQRTLLHAVSEVVAADLKESAESLLEEITPTKGVRSAVSEFFRKARKLIRTAALAAALVFAGPTMATMPADIKEAVAVQTVRQEAYLSAFETEVRSGQQAPNGTLAARAAMYGQATWAIGLQVVGTMAKTRGMVKERNVLGGNEHHCSECPSLTELGWVDLGSLPPVGQRECMVMDRCHLEYMDASGKVIEVPA